MCGPDSWLVSQMSHLGGAIRQPDYYHQYYLGYDYLVLFLKIISITHISHSSAWAVAVVLLEVVVATVVVGSLNGSGRGGGGSRCGRWWSLSSW